MKKDMRHCWFSQNQNDMAGAFKVQINGQERLATDCDPANTAKTHYSKWEDSVYLGNGEFIGPTEDWKAKHPEMFKDPMDWESGW